MLNYLNRRRRKIALISIFITLLITYSSSSSAAVDTNVFDTVLTKYQYASSAWGATMLKYGTWLFWGLVLISMVWTFSMTVLQGDNISSALAEIVKFFAVTGFFWYLLENGPAIADAIIKSMWRIGAEASGTGTNFTPGGVVNIGFDIFFKVVDQSSVWEPVESSVGIIMGGVILAILALVGVNLLLLFISAWVLIYGGTFFLGFGGAKWTSDMAVGFFRTVLSTGAQLMSMVLIIGIGKSIIDSYYVNMSQAISIKEMGVILVCALALLYLSNKIPALIGSLAGGNTNGIGSFGAGAVIGAATAGAAIAATGGALAASGATNAVGGMSALRAAFDSAQAAEASAGLGQASGESQDTGNVDTGDINSNDGNYRGSESDSTSTSNGGSKGFASFSKAGRMAGHMTNSLASGVAATFAEKHDRNLQLAKAEIGRTAGGLMSASIRQKSNGNDSREEENTFDGDSISGNQ